MHPLAGDLSVFKDGEIENKINDLTRKYFMTHNPGVQAQIASVLDTYKEEPISLTYNISDIADISTKNSSFSKTIKLPETRTNRAIFGDISDLGVSPSSFNPNKKTKAWILVDTAVVFDAFHDHAT